MIFTRFLQARQAPQSSKNSANVSCARHAKRLANAQSQAVLHAKRTEFGNVDRPSLAQQPRILANQITRARTGKPLTIGSAQSPALSKLMRGGGIKVNCIGTVELERIVEMRAEQRAILLHPGHAQSGFNPCNFTISREAEGAHRSPLAQSCEHAIGPAFISEEGVTLLR